MQPCNHACTDAFGIDNKPLISCLLSNSKPDLAYMAVDQVQNLKKAIWEINVLNIYTMAFVGTIF